MPQALQAMTASEQPSLAWELPVAALLSQQGRPPKGLIV